MTIKKLFSITSSKSATKLELYYKDGKSRQSAPAACNLKEAYVIVRNGEVFLFGAHISPLAAASTHVSPDPVRTRKLLLHEAEISKLIGKVERAGYTMVPLNLHYTKGRIKCEIGLAKGKKQHDKRDTEKQRDTQREIQSYMKQNRR